MRSAEELASAGHDVLHLEVGQPSTSAPLTVRDAAARALDSHRLGYSTALGIRPLRERIAQYYDEEHGLKISPDRIAATAGASGGFLLSMLALFDPGDRVGLSEPGYAAYRNIIRAVGLELVPIPVDSSIRYTLTPETIATVGDLQGVVTASPSNPTGTTFSTSELAAVIDHCRTNEITHVADEIYHRISFGAPAPTALTFGDDTVVVQSFSKYYSMTGWRIGWLVLPDDLVEPVNRLAQNLFICPSVLAQIAAVHAFDAVPELDDNVAKYAVNRDVVLTNLRHAGLNDVAPADGAFYAWVNISRFGMNSTELSARWLDEIRVAATPGVDFDGRRGDDYLRISYSESTAGVTEAMERIVQWASDWDQAAPDTIPGTPS